MWYVLQRRTNRLISVITYLLLAVLFVSNSGLLGDAELYKWYFEKGIFSNGVFEVGYTFVEKMLHMCGIHIYTGLLVALFLIGSIFVWIGLRRYHISYHCVFAIIMPFIFPTYATAIRFFVASAIMVASIRYLVEKRYWLFALFVVLAGLFHLLSLFYVVFYICGTKRMTTISESKKFFLWFVVFFSILSFAISVTIKTNPLVMFSVKIAAVLFNVSDNKLDTYTTSYTNLGGLIFFFIYLCGLVTAIAIRREMIHDNNTDIVNLEVDNSIIKSYVMINYSINLLLSVILPFVAMSLIFYRLLIIGQITNAVAIGMLIGRKRCEKEHGKIIVSPMRALFLVSCLSWLVPEIVGINGITIKGIFDSSLLF